MMETVTGRWRRKIKCREAKGMREMCAGSRDNEKHRQAAEREKGAGFRNRDKEGCECVCVCVCVRERQVK
jgi:hypothetical protein